MFQRQALVDIDYHCLRESVKNGDRRLLITIKYVQISEYAIGIDDEILRFRDRILIPAFEH